MYINDIYRLFRLERLSQSPRVYSLETAYNERQIQLSNMYQPTGKVKPRKLIIQRYMNKYTHTHKYTHAFALAGFRNSWRLIIIVPCENCYITFRNYS